MRKLIFSLTFLLLVSLHQNLYLVCQVNTNGGLKYFKNYRPDKEHDFQPQNWAVIQDKRGIIYIGNQGGLLEFDGVSWQLIQVPNQSVRSLARDDAGTIYIGGKNEIGFLVPGSTGSPQYVSLVDNLADDKKIFSHVWFTNSNQEGIYFMTSKFLFRWEPKFKRIKVWEPSYYFSTSFMCNGTLFIHQVKVGLMQMKADSPELVRGGETFADAKVDMVVPYDSQNLLIGTRSKGFYLYDGTVTRPFPTEADGYLAENQLYYGTRLSSLPGEFAVATRLGGLVIIDSRGRLKYLFNKNSGLQDDRIVYIFEDSRGNLWLALSKGISRLEYASPISFYDDRTNLTGIALSIHVEKQGDRSVLYTGTTNGLFYLDASRQFHPVPGLSSICWSLLPGGACLLAAATNGVFQVDTGNDTEPKTVRKVIDMPSYALYRSLIHPNRTWVGTAYGLVSLYLSSKNRDQGSQWLKEFKFENITEAIKTIVEDKKGNLWLGTLDRGVIKVNFSTSNITHYVLTRYDSSHGLPIGGVNVFRAAGHVIFTTDKGIFRFDDSQKLFIPDTTLGKTYAGGGKPVFRIAEDQNRNIWFHSRSTNFQAVLRPDGTYEITSKLFLRIPLAQVNAIYPDPGGEIIWFAGVDGLIRCDTSVKKNYHHDFSTYIRSVTINGKHLAFDGYESQVPVVPVLEYRDRNVGFQFAAPCFENESATRYRVFLEGYDDSWSDWSPGTRKDYTNLDPGYYTFRVQARDVYEHVSRENRFSFKVLAPWYRKWWAYLLYLTVFFLGVYFMVRWRSWNLRQEKQRLEQVVKDRTKEIEEKNRRLQSQTGQLEKQTVQLREQSHQLAEMDRVKSRFFANISHEFRTPLTLIMGPLEQLLSRCRGSDKEIEKEVKLALRNSRRLLGLINQLLDLSKLESGKMKLQASQKNIIPFIKGIVGSFDSLAIQRHLNLTFHAQEQTILVYFDADKLEKVITNLISNAVKFTPAGGKITVTVGHASPDHVEISVIDTGIGILPEQQPHIFDRFYQAGSSSSHEHQHKGTGIGLALARELVVLHHGSIVVHSENEKGTEFKVKLPMGDQHLQPEEIAKEVEFLPDDKEPREIPVLDLLEQEEDGRDVQGESAEIPGSDTVGTREKDMILVVDDSADVRKYIKNALEPLYRVKEAANGQQGIDKALEIIPDLILSDIMMPGIDGYELCRVLKKSVETSHIPVILLTAKASEESVIQGLETGADDYITKPFNTRILNARIKNLIDLRRQMHRDISREMTFQPAKIFLSPIDKEFLKELNRMIETNLTDPDFNVEALGKKLVMSRATLYRKILALTGETPALYVQSRRLKRAAQLLKSNFGSVTEVAFEVGFSSRAYFTKCFKEKFHQLPSEYLTTGDSKKKI